MTFWYDASENTLVEDSAGETEWYEETDDGFVLDVEEMPQNKLDSIQNAVQKAVDHNTTGTTNE